MVIISEGGFCLKNRLLLAIKGIYLVLVHLSSKLTRKNNNKIIFLLSFPSTSGHALELLYAVFAKRLVICYTKNSKQLAKEYKEKGCAVFCLDDLSVLLKSIVPLVSGSRMILCDNYFAFLAAVDLMADAKAVQLWHADGAIKSFGLEAKYTENVSPRDRSRYKKVYDKFTHYLVSSQAMTDIFAKSYDQEINQLPFGYLPTDTFFDEDFLKNSKKAFKRCFPANKKIALYVPTYREHPTKIPLDFFSLTSELGPDWQLLVKAHPHDEKLKEELKKEKSIITDFADLTLEELLSNTDYLITDYSSIAFEYPLANPSGKIFFFWYDYKEYQKDVGIEEKFIEKIPGPVVETEEALLTALKEDKSQDLFSFNQYWNEYVRGKAGEQLIRWVRENS